MFAEFCICKGEEVNLQMDFPDLRHHGGLSLHFYSPLNFMVMDFARYCRQFSLAVSLNAAVSAGD